MHAEADFYGSMDGASKFVKGDAIAAIIITLVNLIGGFAVGMAQKGMAFGDAITTYSLLSVGDGLVSQIPALLLSVATGLIVTRDAGDADMGSDIMRAARPRNKLPLRIAGFGAPRALPDPRPAQDPLPHRRRHHAAGLEPGRRGAATPSGRGRRSRRRRWPPPPDTPELLAAEIQVDPLGLELSPDIIDLVDTASGGDLLDRVKALRRKIAGELGIIVPPVRTRDNIDLPDAAPTPSSSSASRSPAARRRRGTVLAIGDYLGALPGTADPRAGLRPRGQVDPRRAARPGRAQRRDRRRPRPR